MTEPADTPAPPEHGRWISASGVPDDTPEIRGQERADVSQPSAPAVPATNGCSTGCLIWAMIPVVCIAIVIGILIFAPKSASNAYPAQAQLQCRQFVKDALKSPASAHFSDEQPTGSGQIWTVTGDVDSDNSFGAAVRNSYSCTVQVDPNNSDNWTLVSLSGLDN